jgi:hypothetical protein
MLKISAWIDQLSEFFAARKGLLPILGIALVIFNFVLNLLSAGWLASSDVFLHLGIILAIFGFLLAWAL